MPEPILVAEDHDVSRMVYEHLARLFDLDMDIAGTCEAARQLAPNKQYKLVIMDIGLPDMDGRDCAALLRKSLPSGTPILAITAFAMAGDREDILASGIEDYLAKPFTIDQFEEKLRKWHILEEASHPEGVK